MSEIGKRHFGSSTRSIATLLLLGLTAAIAGCSGSSSDSGARRFSGALAGGQVVPPVTTSNTATFTAVLSADQTFLDITVVHDVPDVTAIDLRGPAPAGENGPIIFDILANGTITRTTTRERGSMTPQITVEVRFEPISDNFLLDLGVDLNYIQIDSMTNPNGELRGQLVNPAQVPTNVSIEGATMTHIDGFGLPHIKYNAAKFRIQNSGSRSLSVTAEFNSSLDRFDVFGSTFTVSAPDPKTGTRTLTTTVVANSTKDAEVRLNMAPMMSSADNVTFDVVPQTGGTTVQRIAPIKVDHRPETVADDFVDALFQLGGSALELRGIPRLGSLPFLRRNLSTGNTSGTARNQNLLVFMAPTILNVGERSTDRAVSAFPCGAITNGIVICPEDQGTTDAGPHFVLSMGVDATVPLADPTNSYQYGFIFDADGNMSNNFVPDPAFPDDFFQGTDRWYFISYAPGVGWQLFVVDASGVGNPQRVFNDARVVILGNNIMLIAPQSEFALAAPPFRVTSFRHTGDFGANGDFDVSYHPGLDEALEPYPLP